MQVVFWYCASMLVVVTPVLKPDSDNVFHIKNFIKLFHNYKWSYFPYNYGHDDFPNWAKAWQTNKMTCAPNEDSDQPAHPGSKDPRFLCADIEDCSYWVDVQAELSSLSPQVILLVLSCCGSYLLQVRVAHIAALNITNYGSIHRYGMYYPRIAPLEVFVNGEPMRLARWPNQVW